MNTEIERRIPQHKDETGGAFDRMVARYVQVQSGPYDLTVVVSADGKFLGIHEIRVSADFRTSQQKIATSGYLDVDDFYKE